MADIEALNKVGASERWQLVTVIDNGTDRPYWDIFGRDGLKNLDARLFVNMKARTNSVPHLEAMRLVMHSRANQKAKR